MKWLLCIVNLALSCYSSESTLVRSPTCVDNNAVYICTNNAGLSNWKIRFPGLSPSIAFSFGRFFPTTQTRTGPGSDIFSGVAYYINASYSITTVSFLHSAHLNSTILECNDEITTYIYPDSQFLPTQLRLIAEYHNESVNNYLLTWTITTSVINYNISISPTPILGPNRVSNSTHYKVRLQASILYNITVWIICPYILSATFRFVNCPFLPENNLFSVIQYNIDINGTINADIHCSFENRSYTLECGANIMTYNVCMYEISTLNNNLVTTGNPISNIVNDIASVNDVGLSVWVLIASLLGSNILFLTIGIAIGIILGVKMYQYSHNRNTSKPVSSDAINDGDENVSRGPLYEEIELDMVNEISLTDNVAYCQSKSKSGQIITSY